MSEFLFEVQWVPLNFVPLHSVSVQGKDWATGKKICRMSSTLVGVLEGVSGSFGFCPSGRSGVGPSFGLECSFVGRLFGGGSVLGPSFGFLVPGDSGKSSCVSGISEMVFISVSSSVRWFPLVLVGFFVGGASFFPKRMSWLGVVGLSLKKFSSFFLREMLWLVSRWMDFMCWSIAWGVLNGFSQ